MNANLQQVVNLRGWKGTSELIWDLLGCRNVIKVNFILKKTLWIAYWVIACFVFFWLLLCLSVAAGGRGSYSHWWRQPSGLHGPPEETGGVQLSMSISVPRKERCNVPVITQGSATISPPCQEPNPDYLLYVLPWVPCSHALKSIAQHIPTQKQVAFFKSFDNFLFIIKDLRIQAHLKWAMI